MFHEFAIVHCHAVTSHKDSGGEEETSGQEAKDTMGQVLKKYLIWAVLAGILYGLLSYHVILVGKSIKVLEKSELTLNYTFYSTNGKRNSTIMSIDDLREDGIGEILVDSGLMSQEEYDMYMDKYTYQEEDY